MSTLCEPRQVQALLSYLPRWLSDYISVHVDTIPKLLNHLVIFMGCANAVLFMCSWNVAFLPDLGSTTVLVSFLLCCQNGCLWIIFNNSRFPTMAVLAPTEFMIGVSFGISVGGSLLALVISNYHRHLSNCDETHESMQDYVCGNGGVRGTISAVAFWSDLVCFMEFWIALLIAMGRQQLHSPLQYENLSVNDYEDQFQRHQPSSSIQQSTAMPGSSPGNGIFPGMGQAATLFRGDYSTVPEIRSDSSQGGDQYHHGQQQVSNASSTSTHPLDQT